MVLTGQQKTSALAKRRGMTSTQVNTHIQHHVQMALRPALRRIMLNPDVAQAMAQARSHAAFILVDKCAAISETLDRLMRAADAINPIGLDAAGALNWDRLQDAINNKTKLLLGYLHEIGLWSGDIKDSYTVVNIQAEHAEFKTLILNKLKEYPDVLARVQESMMEEMSGDNG